jgi:hypothetical protein
VKRTTIIVVWASLAAAVVYASTIIGLVIWIFLKDTTTVDDNDFPLYKNTRFRECAAAAPDPATCSAIRNISTDDDYAGIDRYIQWSTINGTYHWCDVIRCFNGFKVIPSTANDSAMGLTSLGSWWYFATTIFGVLWAFWSSGPLFQESRRDRTESRCRGLRDVSVVDWILLVYDVCGPMVWWCVSFFFLLAHPKPHPTLSATAWIVTWKYSYLVQIHPFSCILAARRANRNLRKALPWILGVLAFAQWVASIYLVVIGFPGVTENKIYQSYTCLEDQIPSAPGTTTCSAASLCAKRWLFTAGRQLDMTGEGSSWAHIGLWIFFTMVCAGYLFLVGSIPCVETTKGFAPRWAGFKKYYFKWSPTLALATSGVVVVWILGLLNAAAMAGLMGWPAWPSRERDAVVAVDYACRAVHVYLSPWRCFLDFRYDRELRVAKMWFGV